MQKRILLLILLTQTRKVRVLILLWVIVFVEDLVFEGENSPVSYVYS